MENNGELKKAVNKIKNQSLKYLNNTYHWAEASSAILSTSKSKSILVPSLSKKTQKTISKELPRHTSEINALSNNVYSSAFVSMVANAEWFLAELIRLILQYKNNLIIAPIKNEQDEKDITIPVSKIIKETTKEIIDELIESRLASLFYAGPKIQKKYVCEHLGLNIEEENWNDWIEYKARRDLIVHSNSKVNNIYLSKCGENAKYKKDDIVSFDKNEFANSFLFIKKFVTRICANAIKTYNIISEKAYLKMNIKTE